MRDQEQQRSGNGGRVSWASGRERAERREAGGEGGRHSAGKRERGRRFDGRDARQGDVMLEQVAVAACAEGVVMAEMDRRRVGLRRLAHQALIGRL
jgi:hypothetical protein